MARFSVIYSKPFASFALCTLLHVFLFSFFSFVIFDAPGGAEAHLDLPRDSPVGTRRLGLASWDSRSLFYLYVSSIFEISFVICYFWSVFLKSLNNSLFRNIHGLRGSLAGAPRELRGSFAGSPRLRAAPRGPP